MTKIQLLIATFAAFLVLVQSETSTTVAPSTPPTVSLYYESLCPGCHDFIMTQLAPTYQKLESYFKVELVAFGNADVEPKNVIECQHGPDECYGNVVQACLLAQKGTTTEEELTFITCMIEQPNSQDTRASAQKCATDLKLDWNALSTCADGPAGLKLILENANRTNSLQPAHQYVPWIVINGVHTEDMNNQALANLLKYLCVNYLSKDNIPQCKDAVYKEMQTDGGAKCSRDDLE